MYCCLNVVTIQSLHYQNDWTSGNLDYTLKFLTIYMGHMHISYVHTKSHM